MSSRAILLFDQTSNSDVYDRILKNSILGTRLVKKAVICNRRSGAINAYGPEDFTPSIEQINKFMILAQFDQTSNSDVYDRILKNSILGTRLVKKAVICNRRSGAINAYGPEDFTPSIEQINKFMILAQTILIHKLFSWNVFIANVLDNIDYYYRHGRGFLGFSYTNSHLSS
uniref:Uncharacterized protein n=1 Tax=Schistosoma haematobium TaxID=6185 RepID=A0A095AFX3_SCHHA